jgi:hypothetical protein
MEKKYKYLPEEMKNLKSFDWSNHLAYKGRMRAYERF